MNMIFNKQTDKCKEKLFTAQKMKFSMKDFSSQSDHIHILLQSWSHLLKKSLMKNFFFCAVLIAPEEVNNTQHSIKSRTPSIILTKHQPEGPKTKRHLLI